jgi:hypothetical protein
MTTPHESQQPPSPHVDLETLADLQERLLDPARAATAAKHLTTCSACAARRADLDDLRRRLRHGAVTEPAPEDVVRRLDDALAAAVVSRPTSAATTTVTPLTPRRRTAWNTRLLQAAAVVALLAAIGGIGYGAITAGGGSETTTATKSDAAGDNSGSAGQRAEGEAVGGYPITSSGRDYTTSSVRAAVPALLVGKAGRSVGPLADGLADAQTDRLRNGGALAACVANIAGGPITPLAVDVARFDGKPATVIVLPDADDPAKVAVYVVEPACPTGTWLYFERVDRP